MNFKTEKAYGYESNVKSQLGNDTLSMIYAEGRILDKPDITTFIDWVKENYKWYVVGGFSSKDEETGFKTGKFTESDYELYIWSDNKEIRFQISPDYNKIGYQRCEEIKKEISNKISTDFSNLNLYIIFSIDHKFDKLKIENFLLNYKLDLINIPLEKFSKISFCHAGYPKISENAIQKFYEIQNELYYILENKMITINNMEGKFKKLSVTDDYGFFKKRAKNRYYRISLNEIKQLSVDQVANL